MRILAAADSIFRMATEHEPWFPIPTPGHYPDDMEWQRAHLWDHLTESNNTHGPYRGPSILHHPDLPYAIDNGWRVYGGDKSIDHQTRGETGAGTNYLYKIGPSGLIHSVGLDVGPEEADIGADDDEGRGLGLEYGAVPSGNYRHLISGEGGTSEGPHGHDTLRDLVDDEQQRSVQPGGYKDFTPLPSYRGKRTQGDINLAKRYQRSVRRAWQTGTNNHSEHWDEVPEDSASIVDQMPRGRRTPKANPYENHEY
jgi:hypothetical protein